MDIQLTDRKVRCYDGRGPIWGENLSQNIGQNGQKYFEKKETENFSTPY